MFERLRRPAFIVGYSIMAEMSDPRPFLTTTFGKFTCPRYSIDMKKPRQLSEVSKQDVLNMHGP